MKTGKNMKCWGVSYGIVGDLIMGLPVLTYMEKKWPGSYKYWVIEKKVAITAPLYLNHPLIDCIRIMQEDTFSKEDYELASTCEFKCTMDNWRHDEPDWYNRRGHLEETARIAGIYDLKEWLTEEERIPKLVPWWKKEPSEDMTIAMWPFAGGDSVELRSPSVEWWSGIIKKIHEMGYDTAIFGHPKDPHIPVASNYGFFSDYITSNHLSYFEQVQKALTCKMSIGTDSGNMLVMGAYGHPTIQLMTNWLPGHTSNMMALGPSSKKGITIFDGDSVDYIPHDRVLEEIERMMKA